MRKYLILPIILCTACNVTSSPESQLERQKQLEVSAAELQAPTIESTLLQSAKQALATENYVKAEYYYAQLLEKNQKNDDYKYAYAEVLRRLGRADVALMGFEELKKNPLFALDATESAALCLLMLGKNAEASENLKLVIESDPTRWKALNAAGLIFAADGKFAESNQYFDAAAKASNQNPSVLNNQGLIKALVGNYTDAIAILENASTRAITSPEQKKGIDLNLALVYGISGNMEKAEKLARLYLTEPEVYNNLGVYSSFSKNKDLAKTYLNKALAEVPVYYEKAWQNLEKVQAN